jgi:hypothetical protein
LQESVPELVECEQRSAPTVSKLHYVPRPQSFPVPAVLCELDPFGYCRRRRRRCCCRVLLIGALQVTKPVQVQVFLVQNAGQVHDEKDDVLFNVS